MHQHDRQREPVLQHDRQQELELQHVRQLEQEHLHAHLRVPVLPPDHQREQELLHVRQRVLVSPHDHQREQELQHDHQRARQLARQQIILLSKDPVHREHRVIVAEAVVDTADLLVAVVDTADPPVEADLAVAQEEAVEGDN